MARHTDDPAQQAALRGAGRRRRGVPAALPRRGVRAQPVGAGPAGGVPGLRAAVRGVPRPAAAAAAPLLLHLLLAAGEPGRLQHHRGRAAGAGPLAATATFTGVCSSHLVADRADGTVFAFVREPDHRVPAAGEPARPDDHDRARAPGSRRSAGSCRSGRRWRARACRWRPRCCSSAAANREPDHLYADELRDLATAPRPRGARRSPPTGRRAALRAARDARPRRRGLGAVDHGAAIFVCGNAETMAPGVRAALVDIFRQHTGGTSAQAQAWLPDCASRTGSWRTSGAAEPAGARCLWPSQSPLALRGSQRACRRREDVAT